MEQGLAGGSSYKPHVQSPSRRADVHVQQQSMTAGQLKPTVETLYVNLDFSLACKA